MPTCQQLILVLNKIKSYTKTIDAIFFQYYHKIKEDLTKWSINIPLTEDNYFNTKCNNAKKATVHRGSYTSTGLDKQKILALNVNICLPISFNISFGCSKEPSH